MYSYPDSHLYNTHLATGHTTSKFKFDVDSMSPKALNSNRTRCRFRRTINALDWVPDHIFLDIR